MHEKRKAKAIIVGILLRVKRDDGRRCSGNVNMTLLVAALSFTQHRSVRI